MTFLVWVVVVFMLLLIAGIFINFAKGFKVEEFVLLFMCVIILGVFLVIGITGGFQL